LIEHPVQKVQISDKADEARLTPKEMKKMRKLKRREKVKEIQDKIRVGILPPAPPKVRLANLARVLGAAAAADPSKIEAEARAAATARLDAHLKRNEDRKLSDAERRKKNILNWAPAEGEVCKISVFVVDLEIDTQKKFKICKNAQQLQLTGCALRVPGKPLLVVVDGKNKSVSKFERLMLGRIKWGPEPGSEPGSEAEEAGCKRVWSGVSNGPGNFKKFFWEEPKTEEEAKQFLNSRKSEKFWDLIPNS